jgi:hypothetical protein
MIDQNTINEFLRTSTTGLLFHREGQELEFKAQFIFASLAEYLKDFAGFANNKGGYIIFGVTDSPRRADGLNEAALQQFDRIDPDRITRDIIEVFSGSISWEQATFNLSGRNFGVFKIYEATTKPIIAKKDEGRDNIIKNGDILFRYGGRTQKIQYAELESIIIKRIEKNNKQWLDLMTKIAKTGVQNAAILDTEKAVIEKGNAQILVIDEELAEKLKFIKQGEFFEKDCTTALQLVADVVPVERIEVIKKVKENLLKEYPLSSIDLVNEVKKKLPETKRNDIWSVIAENKIKETEDYSAFNFRNKRQYDIYQSTKRVPSGTPSIYNIKAVDLVLKILKNE